MNKPLMKKNDDKITEYKTSNLINLQFTKSLNYRFVLSLLTFNILTFTIMFKVLGTQKENEISIAQLKESLIEEIKNLPKPQINLTHTSRRDEQLDILKLRDEILEKVGDINLQYKNIIEQKQKYYDHIIKDIAKREPASKTLSSAGVIIFSEANIEILRRKQYLEQKRKKDELSKQETEFMASLDLTQEEDQIALREFQDNVKIILTELQENHWQELKRLRNDKYLVVNKN